MNPRRPTPAEPQSAQAGGTPAPPLLISEGVITNEVKGRHDNFDGFFEWCVKKRGNAPDTCRDYVSYLKKPLDRKKKWSVIAYRLYYEFLGKEEKAKELRVEKKVSVPVYKVPSVDEIKAVLNHEDERIRLLYRLLLESGIRLKEALHVLNDYDPSLDQREDGFYVYTVNLVRKSKRSFYAFHVTPLAKVYITEHIVEHADLPVKPKMVRKFVATKMLELGIPSEVVDFLQGRTPASVLSRHYLDLFTLAKKYYPTYVSYLLKTFYNG